MMAHGQITIAGQYENHNQKPAADSHLLLRQHLAQSVSGQGRKLFNCEKN